MRARNMTASGEQVRDDSLLNEIHSLAPYFSYDQGKNRTDDTIKNGTTSQTAPNAYGTASTQNWNDRMKEYVALLTQSLA